MFTVHPHQEHDHAVIAHWWRQMRRENRLFLRLLHEIPDNLRYLPNLDMIIVSLEKRRLWIIRMTYPPIVDSLRTYFLSSQRYFLGCLRSIRGQQLQEAELFYNMAQAELVMLQYMFMERGIESDI